MTELEAKREVLGRMAQQYPPDAPEQSALMAAAFALHFVVLSESLVKFQEWVGEHTEPPTALQVVHAKLAGICTALVGVCVSTSSCFASKAYRCREPAPVRRQ
jgi:hypothetical protein